VGAGASEGEGAGVLEASRWSWQITFLLLEGACRAVPWIHCLCVGQSIFNCTSFSGPDFWVARNLCCVPIACSLPKNGRQVQKNSENDKMRISCCFGGIFWQFWGECKHSACLLKFVRLKKIRARKQTSIQNLADSSAKRPVEPIFQSETCHLGGIWNFGWRTAASGLKPLRRRALWIKITE